MNEMIMPKVFLVVQADASFASLGSASLPNHMYKFDSLEKARDFAKSQQDVWDQTTILDLCCGEQGIKQIERYARDGRTYIKCPGCHFEFIADAYERHTGSIFSTCHKEVE